MSKDEIKELELIISTLDTFYENGEECINPITHEVVLDNEYDAMKNRLYSLCPSSKIFNTVTASSLKSSTNKVLHNPPMTSINKCNGTELEKKKILLKWFQDCFGNKYNHIPDVKTDGACIDVAISYKHDGIALSLIYEKGKLIKAGLRSESGKDGTDVTDKTKYIKGIPQTLELPLTCIIRGELETPISVFNKVSQILGDNAKVNPRAHTAGSMGLKDAEDIKDRGLQFIAYNIIGLGDKYYKTELERATFAHFQLKLPYVRMSAFILQNLERMEEIHRTLDYMVDGVVFSVNDLSLQESLGTTGDKDTGNPKGKLAYKFADEVKKTTVQEVEWKTGRTGTVTPVLIIEPIQLEGTTVSRCTSHNVGIIRHNKIGVGSVIEIIKSGKIIPKLHKVVSSKGNLNIPSTCPSCSGKLTEKDGADSSVSLVCTNSECPAQNLKNLDHFLSVVGVKGISEKTIEKLVDLGLVQRPGDFYSLTAKKMIDSGITERTALLTIARIWMVQSPESIKDNKELINETFKKTVSKKIKVPMEKFFAAFGIKSAGNESGATLAKKYNDWNKIKSLTMQEMENIDGFGPITAKEIYNFFQKNKSMIEEVETYFEFESKNKSGVLDNKTFVLSGSLEGGKGKWEKIIEENGGTVKGSVGRKINYLIAGDGSGDKSEKAKSMGIPILTTKDLEKMLGI